MYLYSAAEVSLINNSRDDTLKEILYGRITTGNLSLFTKDVVRYNM